MAYPGLPNPKPKKKTQYGNYSTPVAPGQSPFMGWLQNFKNASSTPWYNQANANAWWNQVKSNASTYYGGGPTFQGGTYGQGGTLTYPTPNAGYTPGFMYGAQPPGAGVQPTTPGTMPNAGYTPGFAYGAQGGGSPYSQPTGGSQSQYGGQQYSGAFGYTPDPGWYSQLGNNYGMTWDWSLPGPYVNQSGQPIMGAWNESDAMNAYGQPMYTPGPYGNKAGTTAYNKGNAKAAAPGEIDWQAEIANTQTALDNAIAAQSSQKKNTQKGKTIPQVMKQNQINLLQRRLGLLQQMYGGQAGAGVQYAGGAQMASWRA